MTTIMLENEALTLTVRPDLGGRIDQLYDRRLHKDWLWHSPEYDPKQTRQLSQGASFDQHWTGGWDEIFPNDAAGQFRTYALVDHGELWSQAWEVGDRSRLSLTLIAQCQTVPVTVQKTITLNPAKPEATIAYQFQNHSDDTIPFLFKQHAALAIEAGDEILLPDCTIEPAFLEFSKIIGQPGKTRFPKAFDRDGQEISVQQVPPERSQLQEFFYSSDLAIGECGIRNGRSGSSLVMQFDTADFPFVWVFQSYGGWRNFYVLVLEPCTTLPYDLETACQQGTCAQLPPQAVQQRQLTVRLQR